MKMFINKKGQTNTIAVTIAIVLGIALLIFLIWGFSTNWAVFSSTASGFAGKTNKDSVIQACDIQCDRIDEYCNVNKTVKFADGGKIKTEELTCNDMKIVKKFNIACNTVCP